MSDLPQAIARLRERAGVKFGDPWIPEPDELWVPVAIRDLTTVLDALKEITEAAREGMEAFRDYDRASDVGGAGFDLSRMSLAAHSVAALLTRYDLLEPKEG